MKILAFETSCDDTSIALFEDNKLLTMETASQISLHNETGGVVPEVAAREHANNIFKVLGKVLNYFENKNNLENLKKIDYIAVSVTPGLLPSLLTGITVAKTLSKTLNIPLIEINHIEAHIFSNYLERKIQDIDYPLCCLTVSGGHNEIYHMKNMFDFTKVGLTLDDSAGESFDKVAKMLDLSYPGGPIISEYANNFLQKNPFYKSKKIFPRSYLDKNELNFSFSGIKTSVKYFIDKLIQEKGSISKEDKEMICFEFQEAVTDVLAKKLILAAEKYDVNTIMLAGGVSANDRLKEKILKILTNSGSNLKLIFPIKKIYSMDNAAMVGINCYYKILQNKNFIVKY